MKRGSKIKLSFVQGNIYLKTLFFISPGIVAMEIICYLWSPSHHKFLHKPVYSRLWDFELANLTLPLVCFDLFHFLTIF